MAEHLTYGSDGLLKRSKDASSLANRYVMSRNTGAVQADVYLRQVGGNRTRDGLKVRPDALPGKFLGIADRLDVGFKCPLA